MRKTTLILTGVVATTWLTAAAGQTGTPGDPSAVAVYLHCNTVTTTGAVERAKLLARSMFSGAGVNLIWRGPGAGREQAREQAREQEPDPLRVSVVLTSSDPGDESSEVLAEAYPFAGSSRDITVRYDRVHNAAGVSRDLEPLLLAHVLVHEIAHVLQSVNRHSETGIMKARWTSDDYCEMRWKPLTFTPEDVELLHLGMHVLRAHAQGPR